MTFKLITNSGTQITMYKYIVLLLAVKSVFCSNYNLVEVLQGDGESKFIKYISAAGLTYDIVRGNFTIFAPTDAAFDTFSNEGKFPNTAALANILKYHMVKGVIPSSAVKNELQVETLAGTKIRFNVYTHNHAVTVEGSKFIKFDIPASNGVVHVIKKVMTPPSGSIVDIMGRNSDLSTLLTHVQNAGLVDLLKGDNLTLLAPTDAAFANLGPNVIHKLTSDTSLLTEILKYHMIRQTEYSAGLYDRERLYSIDSHRDVIKVFKTSHGVVLNRVGHVTRPDIPATNGVVHVIDHVLIPKMIASSIGFGK